MKIVEILFLDRDLGKLTRFEILSYLFEMLTKEPMLTAEILSELKACKHADSAFVYRSLSELLAEKNE